MNVKLVAVAALISLAGCSSFSSSSSSSSSDAGRASSGNGGLVSSGKGGECTSTAGASAVGQTATQSVLDKIRADTGSATARILKPREMITMEYNPSRVNVLVDGANVVTEVRCG